MAASSKTKATPPEPSVVLEDLPSPRILEETPHRVFRFLHAIGDRPTLRAKLAAAGLTDDERKLGWTMLSAVSGFDSTPDLADRPVRDALAELDAWDEPWFRRAHAALHRFHPDQEAFVFNNLEATRGPEAMLGVEKFLDRLDALETSPDRKATRKADHAALATLATRGIDKDERVRLRTLIQRAKSAPGVPASEVEAQKLSAARTEMLVKLRAWYVDWAETARAVIRRRKDLMLLGLAQRQSRGGDASAAVPGNAPAPGATAPLPAPVATSPSSNATNGGGA